MVSIGGLQAAPGALEEVRELLNSWLIPNDIRTPTERFDDFVLSHKIPSDIAAELRLLRDDLRLALRPEPGSVDRLNAWVLRLGVAPEIHQRGITYRHRGGLAGDMVAVTLDAIATGRWERLKECPDCRWVFYDHTRNSGKRWCRMTAGGPKGRSCGSIAKVRRFRERQAATA